MAAARGVTPSDSDLESVLAFLETIAPMLDEIERRIPPETPPAGMFLPVEESS